MDNSDTFNTISSDCIATVEVDSVERVTTTNSDNNDREFSDMTHGLNMKQ